MCGRGDVCGEVCRWLVGGESGRVCRRGDVCGRVRGGSVKCDV